MKPADLGGAAAYLLDFTLQQLETWIDRHAPGFRLPALFAGHRIRDDARADLAFVLGLLAALGVDRVGGESVVQAIRAVLGPVRGSGVHSFYSYRIAETLLRFGGLREDAPLVHGLSAEKRANLADCCDSTAMIDRLGKSLPTNYVAVLARCELARKRLGLTDSSATFDELTTRTRAHLEGAARGFIDDSNAGIGRYDIYLADIYLFAEPLADSLGSCWERGIREVLELVAVTATRDGTAIPWGRSTGVLGLAMTIELASLGLGRGLVDDPPRWLGRLLAACRQLPRWFEGGVIRAHQHRSTYAYRGPGRRLQMSFDVLGKLLQSALELREADSELRPNFEPEPDLDLLLEFGVSPRGAVWSYRSRQLRFVLPFVGGTNADYLPAPRNPGLFDVPVDSTLATGVPVVVVDGECYAPAMAPDRVEHHAHELEVVWDRAYRLSRDLDGLPSSIPVYRRAAYHVDGPTLVVDEILEFGTPPDGLTLQLCELSTRPLHVELSAKTDHQYTCIDVEGLAEWRSFWGEFSSVHQLDMQPLDRVQLSWRVTPKLRVATNAKRHAYHRHLYDPLQYAVAELTFPWRRAKDVGDLDAFFAEVDLFHIHWPEHFLEGDLDALDAVIAALRRNEVRIIWTQHNLVAHDAALRSRSIEIYRRWAEVADGLAHHSEWGRREVHERYRFRADVVEQIIGHGYFGPIGRGTVGTDRAATEARLGLRPCGFRIGVVGAPREAKNIQLVLDAFSATRRKDIQLYVTSLDGTERVPDDSRITALEYQKVPRELYDARLSVMDALLLPIETGLMLTTGVIGDAVGAGLPVIASPWPFVNETLGDAVIRYDGSAAELTRVLESLDARSLARAAAACRALQPSFAWSVVAARHLELLRAVGTAKL